MKPDIQPPEDQPEEPLNEAPTLREEEARCKYDEKMEELDRRDRAGPHWIYRD